MSKILLTGSRGFIGKKLSEYLRNAGYQIKEPTSNELNVCEKKDWDKLGNEDVEHIVHLAGKTFVPMSWEKPDEFFEVNSFGTLRALEYARMHKINFTFVSAYIYGNVAEMPIGETETVKPNNPYACSKYLGEELCKFYAELYDMNISVLRLFNVYGPGQDERFFIPYIIKQLKSEAEAVEVNDLKPKRDYVYIDDVCKAIEYSIRKTDKFQLYNVGSGESVSAEDVIKIASIVSGEKKQIRSRNIVRKNEINDVVADITAIKTKWNWEPSVELEEGIRKCMVETDEYR